MYLRNKYNDEENYDENQLHINSSSFRWRVILVYSFIVVIFCFIFLNAFQLQLVEGSKNLLVANKNNNSQDKTPAPRGLIYDVNGVKLAQNVPSYSLFIIPTELKPEIEEPVIRNIAQIIGVEGTELYSSFRSKVYDDLGRKNIANRVTLKSDLSFDQYFALLSNLNKFQGVYVNAEPVRKYNFGSYLSNVIGYLGDPGPADIKNGIYSKSQVGKTGIEQEYDKILRGTEGIPLIGSLVDSQKTLPTPGNNVVLSIDSTWQTKLTDIMAKQKITVHAFAGAGVIMNAETGEIKAMVSEPSYDDNLFAVGISANDYSTLINDIHTPLVNRPINLQLPPGSIMKIFGATAALESGTIDISTKKLSDRCMDLPGNIKFCEADHGYIGWVNVQEAMARSSNIFFCKVMQDMHTNPGYNYYYDIAKTYGVGSSTGLDLVGESAGTLPSAALKKALTGQPWYIGDECNTVIGQGYVTVTPMQMTVAVAAIMNGGKVLKPQLLEKVTDKDGNVVQTMVPQVVRNLNISTKTLEVLQGGLRMGVTAGTAGSLNALGGYIVGKTGSSDAGEWINGKYIAGAHSWVMGCFDYQGSRFCFTVMQQWGGRGYKTVPILKKFINCVYDNFANNCDAIN